ncbi:ankyrin repeat domain-containing protein [Actinopolymorpha pittospori]
MPTRPLPDNPSLEHLKNQAKSLQRGVRAGDPAATAMLAEFFPRDADAPARAEAGGDGCSLTEAQVVIARSYGFASWARLRGHLDVVATYSRWPKPVDDLPESRSGDPEALADHFLNLVTLSYTKDTPERAVHGGRLLAARPEIANVGAHTLAAVGDVAGLRELLRRDPEAARRSGGPFDWEPLLYLCYSRFAAQATGGDPVAAAGLLLEAGADPNAGYLWRGLTSPFTALAGAFGGGEQWQAPHEESLELARALLAAGADPNDNQTLYNRMFAPANDHLELLFQFGLGTDVDSPWRARLGHTYPSPTGMVEEQLRWAAAHGMVERVRLLLAHGVDPDGRGYHPAYGDRTALALALGSGHREVARELVRAGATATGVDGVGDLG